MESSFAQGGFIPLLFVSLSIETCGSIHSLLVIPYFRATALENGKETISIAPYIMYIVGTKLPFSNYPSFFHKSRI